MLTYSARVEQAMKTFSDSLREKDRRRYAAVAAAKLGQGGTASLAARLGCEPKTLRPGQQDRAALPAVPRARCRQKGGTKAVSRDAGRTGGQLLWRAEGAHG